jgi:hypothetical protein
MHVSRRSPAVRPDYRAVRIYTATVGFFLEARATRELAERWRVDEEVIDRWARIVHEEARLGPPRIEPQVIAELKLTPEGADDFIRALLTAPQA